MKNSNNKLRTHHKSQRSEPSLSPSFTTDDLTYNNLVISSKGPMPKLDLVWNNDNNKRESLIAKELKQHQLITTDIPPPPMPDTVPPPPPTNDISPTNDTPSTNNNNVDTLLPSQVTSLPSSAADNSNNNIYNKDINVINSHSLTSTPRKDNKTQNVISPSLTTNRMKKLKKKKRNIPSLQRPQTTTINGWGFTFPPNDNDLPSPV